MTHLRAVIIPADYVTVEQAARLIGLNRATIHKSIERGELPAITCESSDALGWRYLVRRQDLNTMPLHPCHLWGETTHEPPRRFGQLLRRLRTRGGWSQRALGARIGVSGSSKISQYESGKYVPSLAYFVKLVEALRCSASEERELMEAMIEEIDYRERLRLTGKAVPPVEHDIENLTRGQHRWSADDGALFAKREQAA